MENNQSSDDEGDSKADALPKSPITPIAKVIGSSHDAADAGAGHHPTDNQSTEPSISAQLKRAEIWMICLTALIVIVGGLQWYTMRGQLDQMKASSSQADKLISETHALATNAGTQAVNAADQVKNLAALVGATNRQAVATDSELSVMQKQLEVTERPWVYVAPLQPMSSLIFDAGIARVTIRVAMRNTGRSPATDVLHDTELYIMDHCCPAISRTESTGCQNRLIRS